jgi:hypothetical protein
MTEETGTEMTEATVSPQSNGETELERKRRFDGHHGGMPPECIDAQAIDSTGRPAKPAIAKTEAIAGNESHGNVQRLISDDLLGPGAPLCGARRIDTSIDSIVAPASLLRCAVEPSALLRLISVAPFLCGYPVHSVSSVSG